MNSQQTFQQGFFEEILKKDDIQAVGSIFKNIYDLIQGRREFLQGETINSLKMLADLKSKTADLHNWILYKYGSGSLADHHLKIVKKIMDGNIDDLNSIENIVHISNQSRGIREVDEFLSNVLYGKPNSLHSERIPVVVGDIQEVDFHINKNKVNQNNLTNPENPLNIIQRGVQLTPVVIPRTSTLVEQMNGTENMITQILNPKKTYKTEHQSVSIRSLK